MDKTIIETNTSRKAIEFASGYTFKTAQTIRDTLYLLTDYDENTILELTVGVMSKMHSMLEFTDDRIPKSIEKALSGFHKYLNTIEPSDELTTGEYTELVEHLAETHLPTYTRGLISNLLIKKHQYAQTLAPNLTEE